MYPVWLALLMFGVGSVLALAYAWFTGRRRLIKHILKAVKKFLRLPEPGSDDHWDVMGW
jgi:hypothetical protein